MLGLGDIGPSGALPVIEEIILIVKAIAPVFGGINLEDISGP